MPLVPDNPTVLAPPVVLGGTSPGTVTTPSLTNTGPWLPDITLPSLNLPSFPVAETNAAIARWKPVILAGTVIGAVAAFAWGYIRDSSTR